MLTATEQAHSSRAVSRQYNNSGSFRSGSFRPKRAGARPARHPPKPQEVIKTWAFDSVGVRKYALQIRKASNGNRCLKIVEGLPQEDGTFRKFYLTIWSEDWPRLFEAIDALRAFIAEPMPASAAPAPRPEREKPLPGAKAR